jgi:hypothetical protein
MQTDSISAVLALRVLAVLLIVASLSRDARPADIHSEPIVLDPDSAGTTEIGRLQFLAGFSLSRDEPSWGGLSGMLIDPDGSELLAVSDVGCWTAFRLGHDAGGRLNWVQSSTPVPLLDPAGRPLSGKRMSDAEALARDPEGGLLVAFERRHRVWRYRSGPPFPGPAAPVAVPPDLASLPDNAGIEAMVALGSDVLLISEGGLDSAGDSRAWLGSGSHWAELGIVRTGLFQPTDATLLPDGDVLLLERRYTTLGGPAARLSVIDRNRIKPGARLEPREIARLEPPLQIDNFEAVAARRLGSETLIYILSDDNQSPLQRTLLLQFRLLP